MRVFLDANILFSAAAPQSATRRLLDAASGYAELVTNLHAWEEARRNLAAKRPLCAPGIESLRKKVILSNAFVNPKTHDLPECDIPILAGAIGAQCTHLWTGDKRHFGRWFGRELCGVTVVSSIVLADILIEKGCKF